MRALTGGSRTRTRVPAEERRCAPVALRKLQVLACLGDVRAYAEHNAVQGETTMPFSVAERLTKASAWYPWHREEVHHGDHQAVGAQWRRCPSGHRVGRSRPPRDSQ